MEGRLEIERFIELRNRFLTSAKPIQSPEHLKGRNRALNAILDALRSPGRHAFIYGFRGVGKTSLAQTSSYQIQSSDGGPILIGCEPSSNFKQLCTDIIRLSVLENSLEKKSVSKFSLGGSVAGVGGGNFSVEKSIDRHGIEINSVNDVIGYLKGVGSRFNKGATILIDEFDQLSSNEDHLKFALLLKQISDQGLPVKFIFCGIAESIEKLFKEHESIYRQIHSEKVDQLSIQSCIDIINDAEDALHIKMKNDLKYRIAQVSDGFPSFVHLICEKVFTAAYYADVPEVNRSVYDRGIEDAVTSVEFSLKKSYENMLHRNTKKYEHVIWAVANDRLLDLNVDSIWAHYQKICDQIGVKPVSRQNVTSKLNQLTGPEYGCLLSKPRRSNYTFSEKMMRAYARLRAERDGCVLGPENAALPRAE